jgi:hypothetical protein
MEIYIILLNHSLLLPSEYCGNPSMGSPWDIPLNLIKYVLLLVVVESKVLVSAATAIVVVEIDVVGVVVIIVAIVDVAIIEVE